MREKKTPTKVSRLSSDYGKLTEKKAITTTLIVRSTHTYKKNPAQVSEMATQKLM